MNFILALSNIVGFADFHELHLLQKIHVLIIISASTLMHLSETKHGLPGIYPFNQYSQLFLDIDRVVAIASFIYFLQIFICKYSEGSINNGDILLISTGFLCLTISELNITPQILFIILHTIWHFIAYSFMYYLMLF